MGVCDEGNSVRLWGWEFEEKVSVLYTPEQVIGCEKKVNCIQLYVPGDIMGETS